MTIPVNDTDHPLSPPTFALQKDEVYLNLVLEYIPETVYKVARYYAKYKQTIPMNFIKVSSTHRNPIDRY